MKTIDTISTCSLSAQEKKFKDAIFELEWQLADINSRYAEFKMKQAVSEREVYVSALEDCGNKILDAVGQGETPHRQIKGLRILLNRPFKNIE